MVDLSRAPARAGTDRPAAIRTALRRCDYRRALALLRGVTELPDGAPSPDEIAAYAQERLSRLHKRPRATTFDRDALQRVLVWLTADELRAGEQALSGEHLSRAIASFERALRIDGRGSRAALLLAMALYRSVIRELSTHDEPELNRTYTDLDQALELLDRAALDPPLRPRAAELARAVDRQRQVLARLRQRRVRSRALGEYIGRYNAFMTRYHGGRMMNSSEKSHARRSLARLSTDLGNLRRQYPVDSPEGRRLVEIAKAVADMQAKLRNIV
ncbi:hypothetical protein [Virgisporangium aurantiacum]|uniref:Uncharacterized protein n=1 Tax=Virgisporangium aurantiacum TaxID=175570 RepID=A0A8J3ZF30_9ACTN|nr:hypothetical protein [Virgisporangium aurantiacum]GIJ60455.1 hypothetical protein Vau01_079710 [Virgisporangium aurantiacum]